MARVLLIHWNATEAAERVERLKRAHHDVEILAGQGDGLRSIQQRPPDVVVIDLSRLPAQGRDAAVWLRQRKATRHVPIVFVEGEPEKVARVRALLPDAVYSRWRRIRGDLGRAIQHPPRSPVVRGLMDGYAGTPLAKKLGFRAGAAALLLGAPADFERQLGDLPEGVRLGRQARGRAVQLVLLFVKSRAELERRFPSATHALAEGGGIWILWPKKASGLVTDLSQHAVRAYGLAADFVDYKICAVDATWSGLLFARRRRV